MDSSEVDVAIVGGGPAGSVLALRLLALGRSVLIVEKAAFPRYHIGESLTGECANLLRDLGLGEFMESAGFPIKRGVTVTGKDGRTKFWLPVEGCDADGARHAAETWQVRRDEFDARLLEEAVARGAIHIRGRCSEVQIDEKLAVGIMVLDESGKRREIRVRSVADCSGQNTLFCRLGLTSPKQRTGYQNQVAFYAQMKGVGRDPSPYAESTHIFYGDQHHWAWSIPLDEQVTSIGIVLPNDSFRAGGAVRAETFADGLATINPELAKRAADAQIVDAVHVTSNYSYHIADYVGPNYLCVGDSHRFLDPIFSFGVSIAMHEAGLAADALDRYLDNPHADAPFGDYVDKVNSAQTIVENIIRTFWEYPIVFLRLAHHSHRDDIVEIFSGRLYSPSVYNLEAVRLMRDLLAKTPGSQVATKTVSAV